MANMELLVQASDNADWYVHRGHTQGVSEQKTLALFRSQYARIFRLCLQEVGKKECEAELAAGLNGR